MSEKRRFPRVSYAVGGLLQNDETSFNCRIENISMSGALVSLRNSASELINLGDIFCLRIGHEGEEYSIAIWTRVAYTGFSLLGLVFLDLDSANKNALEMIIAKATTATFIK